MNITRDDAAQALGEINSARERVEEVGAYANAAPYLIVWGLVWMGCDFANQFAPQWWPAWPIGIAIGTIASTILGFSMSRPEAKQGKETDAWRYFASWGAVGAFIVTLFLVIPVTSGKETHSVFGLLFGCLYVGMGVWTGWRLTVLGAALVVLTLIGFYLIGPWYSLYMGVVSGGALVLGGLWLQSL